jgi:hypothetical protein
LWKFFYDGRMMTFASARFSRRWIWRIARRRPELELGPIDALAAIRAFSGKVATGSP